MIQQPTLISHLALAIAHFETAEQVCKFFDISEPELIGWLTDPDLESALTLLGKCASDFRKETEARSKLEQFMQMADPDRMDDRMMRMRKINRSIINAAVKSAQIILEDSQKRRDAKIKRDTTKTIREKDDPLNTLHAHYIQAKES